MFKKEIITIRVGDRFKLKQESGPCTVTDIMRAVLEKKYKLKETRYSGDHIKVEHDVVGSSKCGTDGWYEYTNFVKRIEK